MEYATVSWVAVGDLACNVFVPYYPMLIDAMYEGYLDVADTSYYAQAASWAKSAGAVSGEAFNPNAACTKTQLDAFVTAAA